MTAELGRQPWLVYGILRTQDGYSATVSSGNTIFSLLGFMGLYLLLGVLFLFLVVREIGHGPGHHGASASLRTPNGDGGGSHPGTPGASAEGR
jgi:cytochrome d ubiquinol oxidase subunit I